MIRRSSSLVADALSHAEASARRERVKRAQVSGAARGLRAALALGEIDHVALAKRAAALSIALNVAPRAVLAEVG